MGEISVDAGLSNQAETVCWVDGTCLYEVLEALSCRGPEDCHSWAWKGAFEVSCAVLGVEHLRMIPNPSPGHPSGAFGRLLIDLADILATVEAGPPARSAAIRKT